VHKILVAKPEWKEHLVRLKHIFQCDIETGFKVVVREVVDWILLSQDRIQMRDLMNTAMNLLISYNRRIF
jgi:hypothetical protein